MQDVLKKDFTLRITQANRTQLVVIIYEICLSYLQDAIDGEDLSENVTRARRCIDELKLSLNFEYPPSAQLLHLYIYVNKLLVKAQVGEQTQPLREAQAIVRKLRDAYEKISGADESAPLTQNAQEVYAGYTYGKNDINVNIDGDAKGRGFLV